MYTTALLPLLGPLGAIAATLPASAQGNAEAAGSVVQGDFTITSKELYPEKCAYDTKRKLLYCSELYESRVAVIDPVTKTVKDKLDFPGLSRDKDYHLSGLVMHKTQDRLLISINTGNAFDTAGKEINGTNWLVIYDLAAGKQLDPVDLTTVTKGAYGGIQDFDTDSCGNIYAVATYPGAVLKISPKLEVTPWHLSGNTDATMTGFTGIASKGNMLLTANAQEGGQLVRFNTREGGGKEGRPFNVPLTEAGSSTASLLGDDLDGVTLPAKYDGKVVLVTSGNTGTAVLRSKDDKWTSAENLGKIANPFQNEKGYSVATVEIGDRIYGVFEWFEDVRNVEGSLSGNRTEFPFKDITDDIEKLLQGDKTASQDSESTKQDSDSTKLDGESTKATR
ncbi:hypothetical protein ED733_000651 [Metarhizium rileyi]|uniref:TRI14-like protein n=1 Tax=Metarhizium rileyi (strain RCEF 4871) TaxID=1649241 RepID=A0A5C6G2Y9_METRR|nr:hypothetical protein ED733_000651 [Metarhizium rileyi]